MSFMKNDVDNILLNFITDTINPLSNFRLAEWYENNDHLSAAVSYYLRCAEYSSEEDLVYESLIRLSICLEKSGNRISYVKGVLLRAISFIPDRPEAYFMLSKIYEGTKEWHESYTMACIGKLFAHNKGIFLIDIGYHSEYVFDFQKSVSGWNIGLLDESIKITYDLWKRNDINEYHRTIINNNVKNIGRTLKIPVMYRCEDYNKLKFKFKYAEKININYSQCLQDIFVLMMTDGKKYGKFLEIGCDDPIYHSNTYLLESIYGWNGISVDIIPEKTEVFSKKRFAKVICGDARNVNYGTLLEDIDYDYLQIDCEPAMTSFEVLKKIPFGNHRFAVITFEHDNYCEKTDYVMDESRKYLKSFGYVLIVSNIAEDFYNPFEDWWVHPDLVKKDILDLMYCVDDNVKKADLYMLNKI